METSLPRLLDLSQVYACKHIHALACTEMHSYSALDLCGVPMMSSCAKVDCSLVLVLFATSLIAASAAKHFVLPLAKMSFLEDVRASACAAPYPARPLPCPDPTALGCAASACTVPCALRLGAPRWHRPLGVL